MKNPLSKLTYFSRYHTYNPKMLSWPFFIRFSSNFHQLPNFWHWWKIRFQNWHIFLHITPITPICLLFYLFYPRKFSRAKKIRERLNSVKKVAKFEITALFFSPCRWVKTRSKFKLSNFFYRIELFLNCFSSRIKAFYT